MMKEWKEEREECRGESWEGKRAADSDALEDVKDRSMGSPVRKCTD